MAPRAAPRGRPFPGGGPRLLGVINATPDSLWGRRPDPAAAARTARTMVGAGAAAIDVGAVSGRPGAAPVAAVQEIERLLPVLDAVRAAVDCPLSVDTARPEVAALALEHGADAINDGSGGGEPGLVEAVAAAGATLIVVAAAPHPGPFAPDAIGDELEVLRDRALAAGLPAARIVCDPGFGLGKTAPANLELLAALPWLRARLGAPLCVGPSRKATISAVLGGRPVSRRAWGTAALVAMAAAYGADWIRVHDVAAMHDVAALAAAVGPPRIPATGTIRVAGLRLEGRHGVLPQEHVQSQPWIIDLELRLDLTAAGRSDRLEDTLNYAAAVEAAAAVVAGPHRDLIERLAAGIASALLETFPSLQGGLVTVHKPQAPIGRPCGDVAVVWPFTRGRGWA